MKKIIILTTFLFFALPSHADPMIEGKEYKCKTAGTKRMNRTNGEVIDVMKASGEEVPFYIMLRNNILSAKFKMMNYGVTADNNSRLTNTSIRYEEGHKYDVSTFTKTREDGETIVEVIKELNINDPRLVMVSTVKYTGVLAMLMIVSNCVIE